MTIARFASSSALVWLGFVSLVAGTTHAGPSGRWIGQDGHDLVGQAPQAGKSDIQDLHFVLTGLPAREKLVATTVKAEGGGLWTSGGAPGTWLPMVVRAPGATTADLYIEPYQRETGRTFFIELTFEGRPTLTIAVPGGRADPNLRTASARMDVRWVGQDEADHATASPNVGPDGIQDIHLTIQKLAPNDEIRSIGVVGPGDARWTFGPNPESYHGAELVRASADSASADLYFHPTRDLNGQTLKLTLNYASGKIDTATVVAGRCNPSLKTTTATPLMVSMLPIRSTWLGQTGSAGDVRVAIEGLPASGRVVGVSLGDSVVGWWADRKVEGLHDALPLGFRRGSDPTKAELSFPPVRDETGGTMTLRLAFVDGRSVIGEFPGGACDPSLRARAPEATQIKAKPGDDLQSLVGRYGTVTLAAGTYNLTRPLVLDRPVTITSEGGATLLFAQAAGEPPWTAAIKVHAGRTTLDRLRVRFAGPVRWDLLVNYGPAVIGTTDVRDKPTGAVLAGLTFTGLDVEAPPASTDWEESPKTLRLVGAINGRIERNVFKGGMVELFGGPWRFANNRHEGTPAKTFTHSVLSAHNPHDVAIVGNRAKPVEPCGKTWRWLVMTHRGSDVWVADNVIEGVGPRDVDTVPHPNSPETILTESYRLHFEGKTAAVSPDGRLVTIHRPQGWPAGVGAVVSILSGPEAGHWRRVAMPIAANAYWLDRPVALGGGAISIEPGFVATAFENNTIDDRGSHVCIPIVLAGNHFGTRVARNRTIGGNLAFMIASASTESPVHWGWSHNPMLGLAIEGNTFEDAWSGATLGVEHNPLSRANRGRIYMTASLADNTFAWSDAFLASLKGAKSSNPPVAIEIGWKTAVDPGEAHVEESGNRRVGGRPGPSAKIYNTTVNGRPVREGNLTFPSTTEAKARVSADSTKPGR